MRKLILPLALFFGFFVLQCTPKTDNEKYVLIGEFSSLTGPEASFGKNTHRGIVLAIEEQNSDGGLHGRKIKLVTQDTKSTSQGTQSAVNELIKTHKVLAMIGEVSSGRSLVAAPMAQKHGVPMLSPASTNPAVTEVGEYIFRICYIDPFQGHAMAKFAREELKLERVAIFKDAKSRYSSGLANFFAKRFVELGGKIVADETYMSGDIDFKSQLAHIRSEKPDAIYIPGYYNEVGLIARQVRQLGMKTQTLLGGDGWDSTKLFEIGREAVNGSYFTNHFSADSKLPQAQSFLKAYKKRWKNRPDGLSAMGYDAAKALFQAIAQAEGLDSESIRQQLTQIRDMVGATGSISIDENRNAIKPAVVIKVDGPNHRYVTTVKP